MSNFYFFYLLMLKTQVRTKKIQKRSNAEVEDGEEGKKFKQGGKDNAIPVGSSSSDDDSESDDASTNFLHRVSKANGSNDGSE
jgi:hypothetical protein